MKRTVLFTAIVLILCMLVNAPAMAAIASYNSTQAFLDACDGIDISYTLKGIDEDGDELVIVENSGEAFTYTIRYYFSDDLEGCSIRVWYIIEYDDSDFTKVLRTCNTLNSDYKYVRFYADESDNTVTASMDLIFRDDSVGEIIMEATLYLVQILDIGFESLSVYDN